MRHAPLIALFLPSLAGGGAERVFVTLANAFVTKGCSVDLLLCSKTGPYLKELHPEVNVIDLQARRVSTALWPLVSYLKQERPVVLMSSLMHSNIIAAIAHRLSGCVSRLVLREANSIGVEGQRKTLKVRLLLLLARWGYRQTNDLVAVSHGVLEQMVRALKLPENRPRRVIFNPVLSQGLFELASAEPVPSWPWADSVPVILGVGRLVPQKDFATLVKAVALVHQKRPVRLIILGEGPEREVLQRAAEDAGLESDFWMPGFVDNPFAYMKRSQVYVLSSRWEGLPNTLIQAMACEAPVVATRCPSGPDEILEGGKLGELIDIGDHYALADAIARILDTGGTVVPREVMESRYGIDTVAEQYLDVLLGRSR